MFAICADLVAQRGKLVHAVIRRGEMRIEQFDEARQHVAIRTMALVHALELEHLLKSQAESLQLADVLEPAHVVVGVDTHPAVEALHRFKEAELLVIADGPLGQPDLRGKLPDPVLADDRRHTRLPASALCQFTSTGDAECTAQRSALKSELTQYHRPSIWSNTICTLLGGVTRGANPYADQVDQTQNEPRMKGAVRMGRGSTVTFSPCANAVRRLATNLSRLADVPSDCQ